MIAILRVMTSFFKQQCLSFNKNWISLFPGLFFAQTPEAALILINKFSEGILTESPKLVFLLLYPLYCLASALSSVLTFKVILLQSNGQFFKAPSQRMGPFFFPLLLTSMGLGLVMIPATLAFIIPGIYVLSRYLFLPFLVFSFPTQKFGWYFSESNSLFHRNKGICFFTAFFSFLISALSFFGLSFFQEQGSLSAPSAILTELFLGILGSLFLNTWTATLFWEISKYERSS